MSTILLKGIVRNGRVEVEEPIRLPEGSEVTITGHTNGEHSSSPNPDEDPMTREEIAALLEAMDKIEPLDWTDEERSAWEAERQARKEWEKAHFAEHADQLRRMWE